MKILFIDSTHPTLKKKLEENNIICHEDFKSTKDEIQKKVSEYNGIILRSRFNIDREFIDVFTSVRSSDKFIARVGAGMEHIDIAYANMRGVKCISSPEGNRNAVAEHALGMLLALLNNISKANSEVKNNIWLREQNRGTELEGKTVGIYGFGNTGSSFAKVLAGFNVKVLAYDKYQKVTESTYIQAASPQSIFETADILGLHLPLTTETNYLVNDAFINSFKKNIYLINTSRGPVVNTNDLARNIRSGKILGACLDVLEYEEGSFELLKKGGDIPQPLKFLFESDKVILTPHIAGWSFESSEKMAKILFEKVMTFLKPYIK